MVVDVVDQILALGSAARRSELHATDRELSALVRAGVVRRVGRGAYALASASPGLIRAVEHDALIGCTSALQEYGVDVPGDSTLLHLSVPSNRGTRRTATGFRRHFEDVHRQATRRLVTLPDAAVRASLCQSYDAAVATLDRVAHGRPEHLLEMILCGVESLNPARAAAFRVDVSRLSRSRIETDARLALRRAGFAAAPGVVIPGVGEVDLLVEGRLVVELDGYAYHKDRRAFVTDRRRDLAALWLGLPTVRLPYEDSQPVTVVRKVAATLRQFPPDALACSDEIDPDVSAAVRELCRHAAGSHHAAVGWPKLAPRDARGLASLIEDVTMAAQPPRLRVDV